MRQMLSEHRGFSYKDPWDMYVFDFQFAVIEMIKHFEKEQARVQEIENKRQSLRSPMGRR